MSILNFSNTKIAVKIFTIVGVMGVVAAIIAGAGVFALGNLNEAAHEMEAASGDVALGGGLARNVLAINRAEYHLAADPSPETIAKLKQEIAE